MHTNYHFLKKYTVYLAQELKNAIFKQCFSQEKDEIVLVFLVQHDFKYLKISLKQEHAYLYLLDEFSRAKKNSVDLWPELYNLKLTEIAVFDSERAIFLRLGETNTLAIKFYGNRSNLLVYDQDHLLYLFNNKLKTDTTFSLNEFHKNYERTLERFIEVEEKILSYLPTLGKLSLKYFEEHNPDLTGKIKHLALENFISEMDRSTTYYIVEYADKVHLSLFPIGKILETIESPQLAMNAYFKHYYAITVYLELKKSIVLSIHKKIKATQVYITEKEASLLKIKTGLSNEEIGNLIMANYHLIPVDAESVSLLNFYTNEPVTVHLKPKISAAKNAEWYYKKSKNEKLNIDKLEENLGLARANLKRYQTQIDELEHIQSLRGLQVWSKVNQKTEKALEADMELFKVFEFESQDIFVGKNAKNNDLLTLKYAKKDDYWFHAKDVSGSHVLVKKIGSQNLSKDMIEYAASIAAYFSKRKTDSLVPVIFTQKKFVRKPKGLPDGKVVVDKHEVILVAPAEYLNIIKVLKK